MTTKQRFKLLIYLYRSEQTQQILKSIKNPSLAIQDDIVIATGISQCTVSTILNKLQKVGIVLLTKKGKYVFPAIINNAVPLNAQLIDCLAKMPSYHENQ